MTFRRGLLPVAVVASINCIAANAAEVAIAPRIGGGIQNYSVGFGDVVTTLFPAAPGNAAVRDGFKAGDAIEFYGAGVTVSYGRLFVDLSGQKSGTGRDRATQFQATYIPSITGSVSPAIQGHVHNLTMDFKRQELNASVGWGFTPEFSAYIGYKNASVDLNQFIQPATPATIPVGPIPELLDGLVLGNYAFKFKYDGAFIGTTYSIPVRSWGAIGLQSSIAYLTGKVDYTFVGATAVFNPFIPGGGYVSGVSTASPGRGSSVGFNVGISFTGRFNWISEKLSNASYTLGVDRSTYSFESSNSAAGEGDFEENTTRARLDLRYAFPVGK
jgi:hypothetical protein